MADEGFKRKLVAILSADVEGYSRLMSEDEYAAIRILTTLNQDIRVTSYRSTIQGIKKRRQL